MGINNNGIIITLNQNIISISFSFLIKFISRLVAKVRAIFKYLVFNRYSNILKKFFNVNLNFLIEI